MENYRCHFGRVERGLPGSSPKSHGRRKEQDHFHQQGKS